ncbi:amidophosphoribosyltransferase [Tepidibacter formicigenes]|uniref:Amidophosphoribosyltransferase n=1 Tax=Tepidibacter formicigenes DSM 15518 TaxID=1123349 RepID=A0A1M6NDX0_9FIRM|nr:amidophosphoribosyltransferase [Tepidibacter formicigenes]SHJ93804.1 amidophosphoribosyltransferase [Tepidibacter formicigenes DSM 15518]
MCGIIGICSNKDISKDLYYGLYSLQHRGQESCGISVLNDDKIDYHRGMGLVSDVLKKEELEKLSGNIGIGHVRYSTAGGSHISNCQPLVGVCRGRKLSLAHNGNLVNNGYLRQTLEEEGFMFQTSIDSEVILYILARYYKGDIVESIKITMDHIKGAYSLVVLSEEGLVAVRDPHGFRPLVLGKRGDEYIVSSESCSIDILGGEIIRDIEPGEIVLIKDGKLKSYNYRNNYKEVKKTCIFEHIYFARNDAVIDNINAYEFRVKSGEILAREDNIDVDIVVPVPDSGIPGALGYSKESKVLLKEGLVKNRYVGRTFIKPTQNEREIGVKLKLNPLTSVVKGKSIVLIDDSIVRGTTSRRLIESLKKAGAKEVHLRITSPPVKYSCYFGIDTPRRSQLIASQNSVEDIRKEIGATSLKFLPIEGLLEAADFKNIFCMACFDGKYPIKLMDKED